MEIDLHMFTIICFVLTDLFFVGVVVFTQYKFRRFSEHVIDINENTNQKAKLMRDKMDVVISYYLQDELAGKLKMDIIELSPLLMAIANENRSIDEIKVMMKKLISEKQLTSKKKSDDDK